MRLRIANGHSFAEPVMQLAKEWEQDVSLTEEETCSVCRGTGYSGPAVLCDSCERNETHLHCLRAPVLESQVSNGDNWYCDVCCSKRNIEPGNFHPSPEELAKRKLKAQKAAEKAEKAERKRAAVEAREEERSGASENGHESGSAGGGYSYSADSAEAEALAAAMRVDERDEADAASAAAAVPEEPPIETDEHCFVCDHGGKLLMCDFPKCPRVYHHACIIKTFPRAIDDELRGPGSEEEENHLQLQQDEAWFCPQHLCANPACRALQLTDCPASMLNIPSTVLINQQARRRLQAPSSCAGLILAPLKSCASCPFALCKPCEDDVGQGVKLFRNKKPSGPHEPKSIECLNCNYKFPRLRLARLLEATFMKLASSKLALPFLRPLVPVPEEEDKSGLQGAQSGGEADGMEPPLAPDAKRLRTENGAASSSSSSSSSNGEGGSSRRAGSSSGSDGDGDGEVGVRDLMCLQEKTRRLEYATVSAFLADLRGLRPLLAQRLAELIPASASASASDPIADSPLTHALETLCQAAQLFLENPTNAPLVPGLEDAVVEGDAERAKGSGISFVSSIAEERVEREFQVKDGLLRLWRRECEGPLRPGEGPASTDPSAALLAHPAFGDGGPDQSPAHVLPRPVRDWERFVCEGTVPAHLRGRAHEDPWDMGRVVSAGAMRAAFGGNYDAGASVGVRGMVQRLRAAEAAQQLVGEERRAAGWPGPDAEAENGAAGAGGGSTFGFGDLGGEVFSGSGPLDSDSLGVLSHIALQGGAMDVEGEGAEGSGAETVTGWPRALSRTGLLAPVSGDAASIASTLDELSTATTRVLDLEARLRTQLSRQRQLGGTLPAATADGSAPVVSIGSVPLLEELRVAHLDLKWRLSQRNAAINASALLEAGLQVECGEAAARLVQARQALAEEKKRFEAASRSKAKK